MKSLTRQLLDDRKARTCGHCGVAFRVLKPSDMGKYCSRRCQSEGRAKYPIPVAKQCVECGAQFLPRRKRQNQRFCSHRCGFKHINPPDHNAKVSRATAAIRADVMRDRGEGKSYRKRNGRHEHRVVAEAMLGRPLARGEIVHHRDHQKRNNSPDNLEVLPSQSAHAKLHGFGHRRKRKEAA